MIRINEVEFNLIEDDIVDGYRELTVNYSYGKCFGTIRMWGLTDDNLFIDVASLSDRNDKDLEYVCHLLRCNYYILLMDEA